MQRDFAMDDNWMTRVSRNAAAAASSGSEGTLGSFQRVPAELGEGPRVALGMILLATDRVSARDVARFLPDDDVELFSTRVPMDVMATPETLAAMESHLAAAAATLVPGGRLDAIGFSCTSGSVAIGPDVVADRIGTAWKGVPVTNPVDAGVRALGLFGVRRIALLTPYLDGPSSLIAGYVQAAGFEIVDCASFHLDGDPEMNRVTAASIIAQGAALGSHPDAEALFISCTGLATRDVVVQLEALLDRPVITSNQAHAFDLLRLAGALYPLPGRGSLFEQAVSVGSSSTPHDRQAAGLRTR